MEKELFKERKELEIKLNELNQFIRIVDNFLQKDTKYYTYPESLEALKNIKSILKSKSEEEKFLHKRLHIVKRSLVESCHHELIFKDELNTFCAICQTLIITTPETTKLEIIIPGQWEDPRIESNNEFNGKNLRRIIYETGEEFANHENLEISEDTFEELQFSSNIKIRRLNP